MAGSIDDIDEIIFVGYGSILGQNGNPAEPSRNTPL
jgi:hypothetical protein